MLARVLQEHVCDDTGEDFGLASAGWALDERDSLPTCVCNRLLLTLVERCHSVAVILNDELVRAIERRLLHSFPDALMDLPFCRMLFLPVCLLQVHLDGLDLVVNVLRVISNPEVEPVGVPGPSFRHVLILSLV